MNLETRTLRVEGTVSRVYGRLLITEPRAEAVPPHRSALPRHGDVVEGVEGPPGGGAGCGPATSGLIPGWCSPPSSALRSSRAIFWDCPGSRARPASNIGVHTIRHSAATAWFESGIHIKAVSDLLGHSSISITGDIYGHTSDDNARKAVEGLSGTLGL